MDEPGNEDRPASLRDVVEQALLAGLGLVALARDKAEGVVGSDEGPSLTERAKTALADLVDELGLVRRERHEELELKVAQLEHRLRLLEERADRKPSEAVAAASPAAPEAGGEQ